MTISRVAGLDGCRAGWVLVRLPAAVPGGAAVAADGVDVSVVETLDTVLADLASGRLAAAAIDVPIGLAARLPRACDVAARSALGPRRNSVFPAPVRAVLAATTYEEACRTSRAVCGKAVSKQLFNIVGKIREVDRLQSPELQGRLFEMHPELSFTLLAGAPMRFHKATAEGRAERLAALRAAFPEIDPNAPSWSPRGARPDDVLDALVGAWSARRHLAGTHVRLGGELDERGLRMEIIA